MRVRRVAFFPGHSHPDEVVDDHNDDVDDDVQDDDDVDGAGPEGHNETVVDVNESKAENVVQPEHQPAGGHHHHHDQDEGEDDDADEDLRYE